MQDFTKINNKKRITSYEHLNKKYDLNFSDYNFGFDWEVFKDFVGDSYARYFTSPSFFKFVSAGPVTNKTWNHLAQKLFFACNFTDASSNILRRYANTHEDTTFGDTINVCNYLYDKYGIDIGPDNENGVVWPKNVKEGGEIVFLSGVRIAFAGYAIIGAIILITSGSSNLIACDNSALTSEKLAELKEKNSKIINGNKLEWIAPQEKLFDTVDNKWYVVIWRGYKNDSWNISKFKYSDWWIKISENLETKYKNLYINRDGYLYSWERFPDFFKSVYRWDGKNEPPMLKINSDGEIKN